MKKIFFIVLVLLLISMNTIYAQSESISTFDVIVYFVDNCLPLLNKPVPSGFQLVDQNLYVNSDGIAVYTENNLVITSLIALRMPPDEYKQSETFAITLSLLIQRYNFTYEREEGNSFILKKNDVIVTVNSQRHVYISLKMTH